MNPRYLARRLISAAGMLAFVLVFNFFLFRIVDSDPLAKYRGRVADGGEARRRSSSSSGSTASKWDQFVRYVKQTVRLRLRLLDRHRPAGLDDDQGAAAEHAAGWSGSRRCITVALGLWMGAKAGWRRGSRFDKLTTGGSMVLYAMPEFWLGMLLLVFLGGRARAGSRPAGSAT